MKVLVKQSANQVTIPSEPQAAKRTENKNAFTHYCIVDILNQLEELSDYNIAIKKDDGRCLLTVGDVVYEISEIISKSYPRRRLRKLDT